MLILETTPSLVSDPNPTKITEVVFSGGGVRGVWQWELYNHMKPDLIVNSFSGASTGSLTSLLAALDVPHDVGDMIYAGVCSTNARAIFEPGVMELNNGKLKKRLKFFWNVAFKLNNMAGLMKIDPLVKTIEEILKAYPRFKHKFYFYTVDLHTGATIMLTPDDFDSTHELARGIAASCAIPVLVEPIRDLKTKKGVFKCCVDGGTREGFPLKGAFHAMTKNFEHQIVGFGCNAKEMTPEENLKGILNIGGATAYNALNELMLGDIESGTLMNYLVRENADVAEGKKDTPIVLYYYKGKTGTLGFTPEGYSEMKETAKADFERIKKTS
jgi:predicted acylesterase/phospholipase RssA